MSQAFKSMSHPSNREGKSEDTLPETTVKSIPGKEPSNFILETLKADAIIAGVLGVYRTGVKVNTNLLITFLSSSRGIRLDRSMVRSLQVRSLHTEVRSLHSKVSSLHQISYFAPYISYFAPCRNLIH